MAKKKKIVIEDEIDKTLQEPQSTAPGTNDAATIPLETDTEDTQAIEESPDETNAIKALEEELASAQAEANENHDRMLRMAAELDNFKKRSTRELEELKKYANESLLKQLLTIVDNLERAIASASPDSENDQRVVDGISLTLAETMKILERHSVRAIESLGQPFDPTYHQAMCQEESRDQPPNTVVQEFQKGYLIHDRLLRPAMVVVSKAAQNGQPAEKSVNTNA